MGRVYRYGDIIYLMSESQLDLKAGEPIPVDIVRKEEERIIAVPSGTQRRRINVSLWVAAAGRLCYVNNKMNFDKIEEYIPQRFNDYLEAVKKASKDSMDGLMDLPKASVSADLVYLYCLLTNPNMPKERKPMIYAAVNHCLKDWLGGPGVMLASGFDETICESQIEEFDFLPVVTVILLLNRINTNERSCKMLAVHMTRMLGLLCKQMALEKGDKRYVEQIGRNLIWRRDCGWFAKPIFRQDSDIQTMAADCHYMSRLADQEKLPV